MLHMAIFHYLEHFKWTRGKKNVGTPHTLCDAKIPPKKALFSAKDKKQSNTTPKDCGRGTIKGGRASPGARPPPQTRAPITPAPKTAEALAVLVQHLVFNLEAFRVPVLRKEVEKQSIAAKDACLAYQQLEKTLADTHAKHLETLEEERARYKEDIAQLIEQHEADIAQLKDQHSNFEQSLLDEHENIRHGLITNHEEQFEKFRSEFTKLQETHEQTLEILREENDSIREEIDEKNAIIESFKKMKLEHDKLLHEYSVSECNLKHELHLTVESLNDLKEENARLKEDNMKFLSCSTDECKENRLQLVLAEAESLRAVLELKQTEVAELRRSLTEANHKAELLPAAEEKVSSLSARCEDLQLQLEQKSQYEQKVMAENKKLQDSFREERNHSNRLSQHNEELQWKLKQNKEVVSRVLEQAEAENAFNRSILSSSFNERHNSSKTNLERTSSFRERSLSYRTCRTCSTDGPNRSRKSKNSFDMDADELSPPPSPKVKGVVEKSDSVSYVLEMEESPEMIANRIVRRSFRNPTPPKNTPTKSPANKRPRMKNNPLSLSASASAIIPTMNKNDHPRSRSASVRNGEPGCFADEVFMWNVHSSSPSNNYKYLPKKDFFNDSESFSNDSYHTASSFKLENNVDLDDDNDDDNLNLPALPSEIGRKNGVQSLPEPKHLAGEAMVSESNSEDESTASSSSGQL